MVLGVLGNLGDVGLSPRFPRNTRFPIRGGLYDIED